MSDYSQAESKERLSEVDSYQALYLLPSAPQELIVEVYWHLVYQLRAAAREDPSLRPRLDELSKAYATVVDPTTRAQYEEYRARSSEAVDGTRSSASRTGTGLRRLWERHVTRRQPPTSGPSVSPWQVLHIDASAPPDVADLAYSFWRLRLRSQGDDLAATELATLEDAYLALQDGEPDTLSEPDMAPSDVDSAPEAAASTAADAELDAEALPVDKPQNKQRTPPGSAQALRPLAAMLGSFARGAVAAVGDVWDRRPRSSDAGATELRLELPTDAAKPAAGVDILEPRVVAEQPSPPIAPEPSPGTATPSVELPEPQSIESERIDERAVAAPLDESKSSDGSAEPLPDPKPRPRRGPKKRLRVRASPVIQPSEVLAHLIAESGPAAGMKAVMGPSPFTIGTEPTCDIAVTAINARENRLLARIWPLEDRFMFHGMSTAPTVLVNGNAVVWAVLEDGDRLQIGDEVFRFERTAPSEEVD